MNHDTDAFETCTTQFAHFFCLYTMPRKHNKTARREIPCQKRALVIFLRFKREKTFLEIAQELGLKVNTVKGIWLRAQARASDKTTLDGLLEAIDSLPRSGRPPAGEERKRESSVKPIISQELTPQTLLAIQERRRHVGLSVPWCAQSHEDVPAKRTDDTGGNWRPRPPGRSDLVHNYPASILKPGHSASNRPGISNADQDLERQKSLPQSSTRGLQ